MEEDFFQKAPTEILETGFVSRFVVVRHAESMANVMGIYQGQTYDTDLSSLGKKQAKALAQKVRDFGIRKIISSPLKRTYQTALEISRLTDIPIDIDTRIIETNHGVWEGKDKEWIKNNYKDVYDMWLSKPSKTKFPDGEHFADTMERVKSFISKLDSKHRPIVVTHDNVLRIMLNIAHGLHSDHLWDHNVEPAAINVFSFTKGLVEPDIKALIINENSHLKGIRADIYNHAL